MTLWPNTRYSLLRRLGEPSSEDAWTEFQRVYSALIRMSRTILNGFPELVIFRVRKYGPEGLYHASLCRSPKPIRA